MMLNTLASLSYLIALLICLGAAFIGRRTGRSRADMIVWLCAAGMFAGLIGMRLLGGEDILRGLLREVATGGAFYSTRMAGQLAALIVLAGLAWLGWHKIREDWLRKRGSRSAMFVRAGLLGMAGVVLLYGLRLISLHAVDQVLYAGPLRLNWVLEGGLTLIVAGAALLYLQHCRRTTPGRWVEVSAEEDKPDR